MSRFTLPGRIKVRFSTAAPASLAAPTLANLTAAIDLVGQKGGEGLAEMPGWVASPSTIPTPDYVSHQVGNVPGDESFPDSSLSFYMDDEDRTIYDALVQGTTGYIYICRDGIAATEEVEVFPVTVTSRVRRPARAEAHMFDVNFALAVPTDGVIAA